MRLPLRALLPGLIALGGLALLLVSPSTQVNFAEHEHFERKLDALERGDLVVSQDVLKTRFRLLGDYDSLSTEIGALKRAAGELAVTPAFVSAAGREAFRRKLGEFAALLAQKEEAIERFKSANALLNNSLSYLPAASTELLGSLGGDAESLQLREPMTQLMQQVLVYCLRAGGGGEPAIQRSIEEVTRWCAENPAHPQAATVKQLMVHAGLIVSRKPEVEALMEDIAAVPTNHGAAELFGLYDRELASALRHANRMRAGLELLCALLVLGIAYTIYALASAQRHLAQRVEERTAELWETNERFEVVTAATTNVIWDWDLAHETIWWNAKFQEVFGYPADEVGGTTASWTDRIHPEDAPAAVAGIREAIAGEGRLWSSEYRFRRHDGSYAFVFDRGYVLRDAQGRPVRMIGAMQDFTDRRQAEDALRDSERHYRDLVQSLRAAVYTCDAEGRLTLFNEAAVQLWGREPELGKDLWCGAWKMFDLTGRPIDLEDCSMAATVREGRPVRGREIVMERPDGSRAYVLPHPTPIRDAAGKVVGAINMLVDLTERRKADQERDLLNRQLLEASRLAGMAEVATGVLHNVGNVLNSVNVSATLVAESARKSKAGNLARVVALLDEHAADLGAFLSGDPRGRSLPNYLRELNQRLAQEQAATLAEVETLRRNIEHIREIVTMQQDYARVSGVSEVLKVTDLVEDSLRMNSVALLRHEVTVEREYHAAPEVVIDKHKALQILTNLIRNAKYACDEGGRTDKRLTVRVANGDGRVRIAVSDNGIGIAAENLTRIFNHGFTTRKEGHGFGLHSAALAAAEMSGSLSVQSDGLGCGATFTLEFPCHAGEPNS